MIPFGYDIMQPMYPLLIQQFLDDYGLSEGIAVDVGTGPGNMAIELAKVTSMELILVDINPLALRETLNRLEHLEADNRISYICADVQELPLRDAVADFVMSRGSVGFWPAPELGLAEIYRILKPGGIAVVGVGCGRYMPDSMKRRIYTAMRESRGNDVGPRRYTLEEYEQIVVQAGIDNYRMISEGDDSVGNWVEFRKQ